MIRLEAVSKVYATQKPIRALDCVSLVVNAGERIAIMGPSGSGKSTLLNLMAGLDTPTSGTVAIDGVRLSDMDDDDRTRLRREKVGIVFQTFNLLPTLTALENVALPLRLRGERRQRANERALATLERVAMKDRASHRPDEMSGGENQRVAIARALVLEPSVLMADEPTGSLDSATGSEILQLLNAIHGESSVTLVLITHNEAAAAWCDRIVMLRDGRVSEEQALVRRALEDAG